MVQGETLSAVHEVRYQLDNCSNGATYDETLTAVVESHQDTYANDNN